MLKVNQGTDTPLASDLVTDPQTSTPNVHRQLLRLQSLAGDQADAATMVTSLATMIADLVTANTTLATLNTNILALNAMILQGRQIKTENAGASVTPGSITAMTQIIAATSCRGIRSRTLYVANTMNIGTTVLIQMTGIVGSQIGAQSVLEFNLSAGAQGSITSLGPSMNVGTATLIGGMAWSALDNSAESMTVLAQQFGGGTTGLLLVDISSRT